MIMSDQSTMEEGYRSQLKLLLMQLGPQCDALAAQLAALDRHIAGVKAELGEFGPATQAAVEQPATKKKARK
jgi:hypothetical protein